MHEQALLHEFHHDMQIGRVCIAGKNEHKCDIIVVSLFPTRLDYSVKMLRERERVIVLGSLREQHLTLYIFLDENRHDVHILLSLKRKKKGKRRK